MLHPSSGMITQHTAATYTGVGAGLCLLLQPTNSHASHRQNGRGSSDLHRRVVEFDRNISRSSRQNMRRRHGRSTACFVVAARRWSFGNFVERSSNTAVGICSTSRDVDYHIQTKTLSAILGTNGPNSADVPLSNKQTNKQNWLRIEADVDFIDQCVLRLL